MRQPLPRLQILLLERRIQDSESANLPRARRVVALNLGFGLAVRSLQGKGARGLNIQERVSAVNAYSSVAFHGGVPEERDRGCGLYEVNSV
jgi:hypothetical protein